MTYRRAPGSFAEAMTASLKAGQEWLAEQIGVSSSRLRQCANPVRRDSLSLHLAVACDVATARLGLGTPLFDCYRRQLAAAGALPPDRQARAERRADLLAIAIRSAIALLSAALKPTMPKGGEVAAA